MSGSNLSDVYPPLAASQTPEPTGQRPQRARRIGRWQLLGVLLVCAAPVIASYFTYYVIRPEGRRNHGVLIEPQRPLPDIATTALDGRAGSLRDLKDQWLLVSVAGGACDAACERQLYLQRQLREVLGRDKDRVDRVWLIPDQAEVRPALLPALAQAWTLRVDAARLSQWLQADAGQTLSSHLYLVDPRGDWMMRFPADADPVRIKKDLMRLLKASNSWDEAGR